MFTMAGGTAQVLWTLIASRILDTKISQTRNGYVDAVQGRRSRRSNLADHTGRPCVWLCHHRQHPPAAGDLRQLLM
jgi:hypothetical protein